MPDPKTNAGWTDLKVACEILDALDAVAEPLTRHDLADGLEVPLARIDAALARLVRTREVHGVTMSGPRRKLVVGYHTGLPLEALAQALRTQEREREVAS